jgi:tripartite-type tricarboxylate transporter receptor subunit TctC
VHSTVPVTSVQELIAFGKAKPKSLNYASSGVGTTSFLSGEIFKLKTGVDMIHVPCKGAGEATAAVIAGQVHLTSARRLPVISEVPTNAEAGLPGYGILPGRTSPSGRES